jgi:hypothetical protein
VNPLSRHLSLHVAGDLGDKQARGQAHARRQGAVTHAGNDQGFTPPQAIMPSSGNAAGVRHAPPEQPAARRAGRRREPRAGRTRGQAGNPHSRAATSSARASVNDSTYAFAA